MTWILPIYMFAAIFGGGIILVDLLGSLTSVSGDDDGDTDVSDSADDGAEDDGGDDAADSDDDSTDHHEHGSNVSHNKDVIGSRLLKVMAALRSVVYFAFGFGVVGWFAIGTNKGVLMSILWSIPVGILFAITARLLKRLQRSELDSQIQNSELILSKASVIVSINKGEMGKIRIMLGGVQVDRYAKAKHPTDAFPVGEIVTVAEVRDEYLTVEQGI